MSPSDLDRARRERRILFGAVVVVAVALVVIGIAVSRSGGGSGSTTGTPVGIRETRALFAGIPQSGIALGSPRAKVTLTEYADLQCPFCGEQARSALPAIVTRYVRTGRVRLVFRALAFLGDDSLRGARMAVAAGLQGRLWQFVDLVYRNQGEENSGWVTDAYLRRVAAATGLDVERAFAQRGSPVVSAQLAQAKAAAKAAGVDATPTFVLTAPGRAAKTIRSPGSDPSALTRPLDDALAGK